VLVELEADVLIAMSSESWGSSRVETGVFGALRVYKGVAWSTMGMCQWLYVALELLHRCKHIAVIHGLLNNYLNNGSSSMLLSFELYGNCCPISDPNMYRMSEFRPDPKHETKPVGPDCSWWGSTGHPTDDTIFELY
jgi:hypothetical protein